MEQTIDLIKKLLPYAKEKLWVAFSPDYEIVGTGKDPKEAVERAKEKKVFSPILLQALEDYSGFVPQIR